MSVFILISNKGNAKECSDYHTTPLISYVRKVVLKSFKLFFNSMWPENIQMFKLVLHKAEESETKLQTSIGSSEKQESSRKNIYFCFIDYAKAFDCVDHSKLWKILKEMGLPDHLTCLFRNLYADQKAIVKTGHGTIDQFQIEKWSLYIVTLLI